MWCWLVCLRNTRKVQTADQVVINGICFCKCYSGLGNRIIREIQAEVPDDILKYHIHRLNKDTSDFQTNCLVLDLISVAKVIPRFKYHL